MTQKAIQATQALQHRFPVWFQTQALIRGVDQLGLPELPHVISRTYNVEVPVYGTLTSVDKEKAEDEIRYGLVQSLTDAVEAKMTVLCRNDRHLGVAHLSGSIDLLIMTVDEFLLAADMENEARAIELHRLREENRSLRKELQHVQMRDVTFSSPK